MKRTIIYIDGFNFYYGFLIDTNYKWLNLEAVFDTLLSEENNIIEIKYFTADVRPSKFDPEVDLRQQAYFGALEKYCNRVKIIKGFFSRNKTYMPLVKSDAEKPDLVNVWKVEEKGSDVNLCVHMLNDAWLDNYDCAVLVSNDSDMTESLKLIKENHPDKVIGLVSSANRKRSKSLVQYADFTKVLRTTILEESQLPECIPHTKIRKPTTW